MLQILVEKAARRLSVSDTRGNVLLQCPVALGKSPLGHKQRTGDGKTPEGIYYICLKRETGKFGCALGISYPSARDAEKAYSDGIIDAELLLLFKQAEAERRRPPWGTPLGGEIYLHGGGAQRDWTAGCIALEDKNMAKLFQLCQEGDTVQIIP